MDLYELRESRNFEQINTSQKILYFQNVAKKCAGFWNIPTTAMFTLLNYTENATFDVSWGVNQHMILRIHRQWYTTKETILSELAWLKSLREVGIRVPKPVESNCGQMVVQVETEYGLRLVDCEEFETGKEVIFSDEVDFEAIGNIIAQIHINSMNYNRPTFHNRINWGYETTFSEKKQLP